MTTTKWRPPSLLAVLRGRGEAMNTVPSVRCACGRTQTADLLVDLHPLAPVIREAFPYPAADFACDGCMARVQLTRPELMPAVIRALGAPEPVIARAEARWLPRTTSPSSTPSTS